MSNLQLPRVTGYDSALALLKGRSARTIAYATELVEHGDTITLCHHGSGVVQWHAHAPERVTFTLAGWDSNTTLARVDQMLYGTLGLHLGRSRGKVMLTGLPYGHALEIAPYATYTVINRADSVVVNAAGSDWQYVDAGHPTYKFYR